MMNIPFSPPDITQKEIDEVTAALKCGWITTGPKTKKFENMLAEYIGTNRVVCLNSATAAEELNLRVLGIGKGDEVLVPAYTYTSTASAAIHVGAKVKFVDCKKPQEGDEWGNLEMDYDALEAAITEKTKAIVAVDLGGIICDYDKMFEIADRKRRLFTPSEHTNLGRKLQKKIGRVIVLSDCAHALGASQKGKMAGNIADFTSFSFHAVKNLTTAEGGAATWRSIDGIDDDEIYGMYQLYSLHGQNKDAFAKAQLGSWEYDIIGPWYKCNMTDIMAAIGIAQLERYPGLLERRKEIIKKYDEAFRPLGIEVLNHYTDDSVSSGHLYITRVPNITSAQRNEIIIKMAEKGIATNVHYKPLPLHTAYRNLGFDIKDCPNAYARFVNSITLPLHTKLTDEEVQYVIDSYSQIFKEYI